MTSHSFRRVAAGIVARLGLGGVYVTLDRWLRSVQIALHGGTRTASVGDVTVEFALSSRMEYRRATDLCGERTVIGRLLDRLDGDETVWDVGAGVGTYACFVATALSSGELVAFEPEPVNRRRLSVNLQQNGSSGNHQIQPVALWDTNGTQFLESEFSEAGAGHHFLSTEGHLQIETRRGTWLVQNGHVSPPDVLKIDVQGGELRVLRGCESILDDVQQCIVEIHPAKLDRYDDTAEEVETYLQSAGFTLENLGTPTNGRETVYLCYAYR